MGFSTATEGLRAGARESVAAETTLRVAYVTRGVPHYRIPVLRALSKRGVSLHVAACRSLGPGFIDGQWAADGRSAFVRLQGNYPRWRADVLRWLEDVRPSVILLEHGAALDFTWTILFNRRLGRTPRVLWTHGIERREIHSGRAGLGAAARWWQLQLADAVICYEDTIADRLRRALPRKIVGVARNTTGGPGSSGSVETLGDRGRAALKQKLGLEREFYILGLGRLVPEKEFHRLPDVLTRVRQAGVDAGLILVGDGPSKRLIEERAARHNLAAPGDIVFAGAIGDPRELATWLAVSDVHLHPGAIGLAVVDSAFAGIPTVVPAPSPGGPFHGPEWVHIRNGETGWVVEENTDHALTEAAVRFLTMPPAVRRDLSDRCRDYARRNLSIDRMVDGMVETIDLVLRSRGA